MSRRCLGSLLLLLIAGASLFSIHRAAGQRQRGNAASVQFRPDLETRLRPLAEKLGKPNPGDWRFEHPEEKHESFDQYVQQQPVRKSNELRTIYLCLLGDFSKEQEKILEINREYLGIFFQTPVKILNRVPLDQILAAARRKNPSSGQPQILTRYVLKDVLLPKRPRDALAYIAFTGTDLWARDENERDWNFVFGQAGLRERVGVWSLARFGDPATDTESFQHCLKLTLGIASHETSHILTMPHCSEFACSQNGTNHLEESESKPLHVCPSCFRKLCWNLRIEPVEYCRKLRDFSEKYNFPDEVKYYDRAIEALKSN